MKNGTKTTNNETAEAAPPALDAMGEFDRLNAILAATHREIPRLLEQQRDTDRRLGASDTEALRAELQGLVARRQQAARKRTAAIASILELEPALQAERAGVERDRQSYAVAAVSSFRAQYDAAVSQLQSLWRQAEELGKALRVTVPTPMPVRLQASVIDGTVKAVPVMSNDEAPLADAEAVRLGAALDRVDQALSLCYGIRAAKELDAKHYRLSTIRGAPTEFVGVFRVTRSFRSQIDTLEFAPGDLVDGSLVGHGMLHRLQIGRCVEPAELGIAARYGEA